MQYLLNFYLDDCAMVFSFLFNFAVINIDNNVDYDAKVVQKNELKK